MNTKKVSLITNKDYSVVARRNGSPFLTESEKSRVYKNTRVNGTSVALYLVARVIGEIESSIVSVEDFRVAYSKYKEEKKANSELYKVVSEIYRKITKREITKKEAPVLSAFARASGVVKGFEIDLPEFDRSAIRTFAKAFGGFEISNKILKLPEDTKK